MNEWDDPESPMRDRPLPPAWDMPTTPEHGPAPEHVPIKPNREWPANDEILHTPPVNRAQAVIRVFLWLVPATFTVFVFFAANYFTTKVMHGYSRYGFVQLIIVAAFTAGTGWFNAMLSPKARRQTNGMVWRTVLFCLIQIFLIPLLIGGTALAVCMIAAR